MSYPVLQTPQRPLPGTFFQTPAASRYNAGVPPRQPIFRPSSVSGSSQQAQAQSSSATLVHQPQQQSPRSQQPSQERSRQPIERGAAAINNVLAQDASFPAIDSYVQQGISSDYEAPTPTTEPSWAPFQKTKMYDIPDQIFEQYNRAQVQTMMGLFAELNHAWVTIDNAFYMWDYTHPNPELIGYEENPNSITAVKLIIPRPGVFINDITKVLVLATTTDILLIGVSVSSGPSGVQTVSLYRTNMSLNIRGIDVRVIEGSNATGRIFFAGGGDNDVYELQYEQEEGWFSNRCTKKNQTSTGYSSLVPRILAQRSVEHVRDMVVDDTRNLLYTLSSESSIRTFHLDSPKTLRLVIEKKRTECLRDISHMISQTPLLTSRTSLVSISPISATESSRLHLMATTSTGCRLFLSATRGYGYLGGDGSAPQSMQVQHIKFPPRDISLPSPQASYSGVGAAVETQSPSLSWTRKALRFPPGFFLCFVTKDPNSGHDDLFASAPDSGRIAWQTKELTSQAPKYYEQAVWMDLGSRAEAIGLINKPFSASRRPEGFGNELAVQFDESPTEIAILTNTGIHTIRRRRLVDVLASAIRQHGGNEGLENEVKKFIKQYGTAETTGTALAVACGHGSDVSPGELRSARISDPETLELARKVFVEFGGRPVLKEDTVMEGAMQAADIVKPSSRHAGIALYIARHVRSIWKAPVISQGIAVTGEVLITSTIPPSKLMSVQEDLTKLSNFLESNKSFIEGLTGPEGLQRVSSDQEAKALQGEHQHLHSLQVLNSSIIEGISFILTLFDERMDEIWSTLNDQDKQRLRDLTYENLFASDSGRDLAKHLVKSIVNRNIAKGSNINTVAEALRRRCGSFCSADDVVIFKAQELLNKAAEGTDPTKTRQFLNESLLLFMSVSSSLSLENLKAAVEKFANMQFYAGAITLALEVARDSDRGNRALSWVQDGKPGADPREAFYEKRKQCYSLIHQILQLVDDVSSREPEMIDGRLTVVATRRNEAHEVVNLSKDEVFQFDLYDWYLSQGWIDQLLAVDSEFVEPYLVRLANSNLEKADLLWKYYANHRQYFKAAQVQLHLAQSDFDISLTKRINYLSSAKTYASTQERDTSRTNRQVLLHTVSELLEVANIQDELLHKLRAESRLDPDRKADIVRELDGLILGLTELYNRFADPASYFDICLMIYQAADHRVDADIMATWQNILDKTHSDTIESEEANKPLPYEAVITTVSDIGSRLNYSETTFSPAILIPMIEKYALECQRDVGPKNWVVDLFLHVRFSHETILSTLSLMFYNDETPFTGRNRKVLAEHMFYVIQQWYRDCASNNLRLFGGQENAEQIVDVLREIMVNGGFVRDDVQACQDMIARIEREFR